MQGIEITDLCWERSRYAWFSGVYAASVIFEFLFRISNFVFVTAKREKDEMEFFLV
jgi:hypothetical protein